MLGTYDFCGHYDWTFGWLERQGGAGLVRQFWSEAIGRDSQQHLAALLQREGFAGMRQYWGHTLAEESPDRGFTITEAPGVFRIDMHDCPSKGFLLRNGLENFSDYCDHCMGWVGPTMLAAGYVIDHEHNHCGQCWWEMRRRDDATPESPLGAVSGERDVRARPDWNQPAIDHFRRATDPDDKQGGIKPARTE